MWTTSCVFRCFLAYFNENMSDWKVLRLWEVVDYAAGVVWKAFFFNIPFCLCDTGSLWESFVSFLDHSWLLQLSSVKELKIFQCHLSSYWVDVWHVLKVGFHPSYPSIWSRTQDFSSVVVEALFPSLLFAQYIIPFSFVSLVTYKVGVFLAKSFWSLWFETQWITLTWHV